MAKKKRDWKKDYARRMARGKARGLSKSQARGHPKAGERSISPKRKKPDAGLEKALRLLSQLETQSAAAKKAGIAQERLSRFVRENNLVAGKVGRRRIVDSGYRDIASYVDGRSVWLKLWRFGKHASLNGKYMNAVGQFLESKDISRIEPFAGKSVRDAKGTRHFFETDPNELLRLTSGDEPFEQIYRFIN